MKSGQYRIEADHVEIGEGTVIEDGVVISGINGPARHVVLGDNVFIGASTVIRVPEIRVGDYTSIHNHGLVSGYEPISLGHNCWIGQNTILNSTAPMTIGDNCGIGAYSQLWTHILYGDTLMGCRFDSAAAMTIGKDVWFVGHCVVAPITAGDRSMAMLGSVITSDMIADHTYGGAPARDLTDKLGPQFKLTAIDDRIIDLSERLQKFLQSRPEFSSDQLGIAADGKVVKDGQTMFDVAQRTYTKRRSPAEIAFMKFLLPRAKFTPVQTGP